MSEPTKPLR